MSLQLQSLSIHHKHQGPLIEDINMLIEPGEILTLMGPSGCGKSTLLSTIAGHLSDDFLLKGKIVLNQQSIETVPPHQRQIGILFQDDLLFPHLNVWENIAIGLPNEIKRKERKQHVIKCLQQVNLDKLACSMPHQISGGQRARVSLLRMLQAKPKAVLLDEPFNKLDKDLRVAFRHWVFTQLKQAKIPTLMVTHDQVDAPENAPLIYWENLKEGNYHA